MTSPTSTQLTLKQLIIARNWGSVLSKLVQQDANVEVEKVDELGELPLHAACHCKAPWEVVKTLIKVYPSAASLPSKSGNLPLHVACRSGAPIRTVQALLDVYEEGASSLNGKSCLPLHLACDRDEPHLDVVNCLVSIYPEGASKPNKHGDLPVHLALDGNFPLELVKTLLRVYPKGASKTNADGFLPLHVACDHDAPIDVVQTLHYANPKAVFHPIKDDGRLPLHLVNMSDEPQLKVIKFLLDAYPDSHCVPDITGDSWSSLFLRQ